MFKKILIANRGEISIRIARAAAELGIRSVAIYSEDDEASLHTKMADDAILVPGSGAKAYLDISAIIWPHKKWVAMRCIQATGFCLREQILQSAARHQELRLLGPVSNI